MLLFMKIWVLLIFLFSMNLRAEDLVAPAEMKKCKSASDCEIVRERSCGMPESVSRSQVAAWNNLEAAHFKADQQEFPNGKDCEKTAPSKIKATCIQNQCGWKFPDSSLHFQ